MKTNIIHREKEEEEEKTMLVQKKNLFVFSFIYLLKNQE